jgi:hypothetical protein
VIDPAAVCSSGLVQVYGVKSMGFLEFMVLAVYGGGAWKFWNGFKKTNFSDGKVKLTALWPIMLLTSKSYRENFGKAIK